MTSHHDINGTSFIPLSFNIIPKCTDVFLPYWHEFKNSATAGIGLLHSDPFPNSHFHFLVIVELAISQVLLQ
jgi:hypothetical protein